MYGKIQSLIQNELDKFGENKSNGIGIFLDDIQLGLASNKECKILVLIEPHSVMPENYNLNLWSRFDSVVIASPWKSARYVGVLSVFQPIERPEISFSDRKNKINEICLINDLKFGSVSSSLYSWRLEIIKKLQNLGVSVDVYGPNWSMSYVMEIRKRWAVMRRAWKNSEFSICEAWSCMFFRPSNYLGQSPNKMQTLLNYEYALVIENDIDSLSEKLFDAIFSGAKVFYRGPNLEKFSFLKNLCVALPDNLQEAAGIILGRDKIDWKEIEQSVNDFIDSPESMGFCSIESLSLRVSHAADNLIKRYKI